ncbi:MAG: hypothetical protein AAFA34_03080 [Thermoplasmata archaeon]|jgi:hypothetical protein
MTAERSTTTPRESVSVKVTVQLPARKNVMLALGVSAIDSEPTVQLSVYGGVPPPIAALSSVGTPTLAVRAVAERFTSNSGFTARWKVAEAPAPTESFTSISGAYVPARM